MEGKVDLHLHSYYSDGAFSPGELVRMAKERGLRAISLTDHDCLDGIDEALSAGEREGVEVIPGVELSVEYEGVRDIHILGYLFDYRDESIEWKLQDFRRVRRARGRNIVEKVNAHLLKRGKAVLDYREIASEVKSALGRPHIARKLVEMGHASDMAEAFGRFLELYNVPKAYFTPSQAVSMLHSAGGAAVLAHPGYTYGDLNHMECVISYFASLGLDGVEVLYGDLRPGNEEFFQYLCERYRLILTGGSDFHGDRVGYATPHKGMDIFVPYSVVDDLKQLVRR